MAANIVFLHLRFRIVYEEWQNYIGIVEHIYDARAKYLAS